MRSSSYQPGHPSSAASSCRLQGYKPLTVRAPSLCGARGRDHTAGHERVPRGCQQPEGNGKAAGRGQVTRISSGMLEVRGAMHGKRRAAKRFHDRAWSDLFLPQLCGNDACAAVSEAAACRAAGGDRGAASRVALWGAVYLFFFSVTLHNVR